MTASQLRSSSLSTAAPGEVRSIHPRRGLPGGRAVVGGLLVAASAVGLFASVADAHHATVPRYAVAAHDLRVGAIIRPGDVELVPVGLGSHQAELAFHDRAAAEGHVLLAPMSRGELIQASDLAPAGHAAEAWVSLALDPANAVEGMLQPGDRVDVFVSYGSGITSSTRRVIAAAEVVAVGKTTDGIGDAGDLAVTLAVSDASRRIDLVNAAHAGTLTLARVTGSGSDDDAGSARVFVERGPGSLAKAASQPQTSTTRPR